MRRPRPLTEDLTISEGFSTRQALDNDVPSKRLRAGDLVTPHHGIRMSSRVLSPHGLDQSFASAGLIEGEVLADVSGARWWGLPLPRSLEEEMLTHVAVARPSHPPSGKRIVGHRLDPKRFVTAQLRGVQTLAPSSLLAHLAGRLELTQAVVFADALRTSFEHYPGRSNDVPVYSLEELSAVAQLWKGRPGAGNLRAALELSRAGSESPKETELRLLIIGAGFGEPTMQHKIYVPGYGKARIDLAYVREKIAIEFEGEGHFSDPAAARRDLERTEALQRAGWRVIRVTKADLRRPWNLLESIRLALAERAGLRA
ncbi:endonuclease domain-containing protein [Pseudoclavibacter helvolus]|uniref:endonuclease domain-containing protein n=1 Tax=Pseudoclavibacter helvolus TaxID=255205 RepID=UPI003C75A82C